MSDSEIIEKLANTLADECGGYDGFRKKMIADCAAGVPQGSVDALNFIQLQRVGNDHERAAAAAYLDSFEHRGNPKLELVA